MEVRTVSVGEICNGAVSHGADVAFTGRVRSGLMFKSLLLIVMQLGMVVYHELLWV